MADNTSNNKAEANSPKASRRHPLGRRKSDWIIPLILFTMALMAGLWAIDSYSKARQMEEINDALSVQSQLLDRLLQKGDEDRARTAVPPNPAVPVVPPPAPYTVTPVPTANATIQPVTPTVPTPAVTVIPPVP